MSNQPGDNSANTMVNAMQGIQPRSAAIEKAGMNAVGKSKGSKVDDALMVNQLQYRLGENLSCADRRSLIRSYAQLGAYNGGGVTATLIVNSGDLFIDPRNSWVSFTIAGLDNTNTVSPFTPLAWNFKFGTGSAMNVFQQVISTTASGTEVERIRYMNVWNSMKNRYKYDNEFLLTAGSVAGYAANYANSGSSCDPNWVGGEASYTAQISDGGSPAALTGSGQQAPYFVLPLSWFGGIYDTDCLLPASLIGGMRVDLLTESIQTAFVLSGAAAASAPAQYQIQNLTFMLDSVQLDTQILRKLNEISARDGLVIQFDSIDHTPGTVSTGNVSLESRRAVNRACAVYVKDRATANVGTAAADSFASSMWNYSQFQFQLGGLFFPIAPIQVQQEAYMNALYSWCGGKVKYSSCSSSVSISQFLGGRGYNNQPVATTAGRIGTDSKQGEAIMSATLERSSALELSGLPVSNSRVLQLLAQNVLASPAQTLDMFLVYTKVAKVFIGNTLVLE